MIRVKRGSFVDKDCSLPDSCLLILPHRGDLCPGEMIMQASARRIEDRPDQSKDTQDRGSKKQNTQQHQRRRDLPSSVQIPQFEVGKMHPRRAT